MKEWEAKFIKKRIRDCIADMNGKEVSSGSGRTQSNNNKKITTEAVQESRMRLAHL